MAFAGWCLSRSSNDPEGRLEPRRRGRIVKEEGKAVRRIEKTGKTNSAIERIRRKGAIARGEVETMQGREASKPTLLQGYIKAVTPIRK